MQLLNNIENTPIIRPVKEEDLEALLLLASKTGPGMTSLPADPKLLELKIKESINSFKIDPIEPSNEAYRFVLEFQGQVIGVAAIRARVGGFEPFYSYEIAQAHHQSTELGVDKEVPYLKLCKEHNGPSIISSLFVLKEFRAKKFGRLLSQTRFLFMAEFPQRFTESVIAEMRGYINEFGKSPFWEGTVRHFFDMDFTKADYLSAKDKAFIADLMPQYPLYIPLLREEVVKSIGQVHSETLAAMFYLENEGFQKDGHVDIFDAGPRVKAKIQEIRSVKQSKKATLNIVPEIQANSRFLLAKADLNFLSFPAWAEENENLISLDENTAKAFGLAQGDKLRYIKI